MEIAFNMKMSLKKGWYFAYRFFFKDCCPFGEIRVAQKRTIFKFQLKGILNRRAYAIASVSTDP